MVHPYSGAGLPDGPAGKAPSCNPGDARDVGSIPGSGRAPGEGNGNHSSALAWKIPRTEEPGELQSKGLQRDSTDNGVLFNTEMNEILMLVAV